MEVCSVISVSVFTSLRAKLNSVNRPTPLTFISNNIHYGSSRSSLILKEACTYFYTEMQQTMTGAKGERRMNEQTPKFNTNCAVNIDAFKL